MFCPKCGSMLTPKKVNGKNVLACSTHGPVDTDGKIKQESKKKLKSAKVMKEGGETHPIIDNECPKCRNRKAYAWMVQTRAADEAPTRFYRCTKCNHQWKEYS